MTLNAPVSSLTANEAGHLCFVYLKLNEFEENV